MDCSASKKKSSVCIADVIYISSLVCFGILSVVQLVSNYQLNAQFLYSITIYMLLYNPQHVSSSTTLIIRRTNCITAASGIVTLCKRPYSVPVDRHTVRPFTESDDNKCCSDTICPPYDERGTARNMLRIIM